MRYILDKYIGKEINIHFPSGGLLVGKLGCEKSGLKIAYFVSDNWSSKHYFNHEMVSNFWCPAVDPPQED